MRQYNAWYGSGWSGSALEVASPPREVTVRTSVLRTVPALLCCTALAVAQVANDECGGASPVGIGNNGPYSNVGSTPSAPGSTCYVWSTPDVWFVFTAPQCGRIVFDTVDPGTSLSAVVEVFSGNCGSLTSHGCGYGSVGFACATAGTDYYVRVGGINGATGTFRLIVTFYGQGSIVGMGAACGDAQFAVTGDPNLGGTLVFTLQGVPGDRAIGFGFVYWDLMFCNCHVGPSWDLSVVTGSVTATVPMHCAFVGVKFWCQGAILNQVNSGCVSPSGSVALSHTYRVTIGCR